MSGQVPGMSVRFKARMAGSLYVIAILVAVFGEFMIGGKQGIVMALLAVPCYVAVTLLVFVIFKRVNKRVSALALTLNLLGLGFEAIRLNPGGVDIALVLHGIYCVLIGKLVISSRFVPRILAWPLIVAGFGWATFLSPAFASRVSPYNLAFGLLGESTLMLFLLVAGVDVPPSGEPLTADIGKRL